MCKLFMKDNNCLLLTGTIDSGIFHNVGNRITNTSVRLEQYVNSIKKYIDTILALKDVQIRRNML